MEASLFYFILVFIDFEIIPIVLRTACIGFVFVNKLNFRMENVILLNHSWILWYFRMS